MVGTLNANGLEQVAVGPPDARWILLEPPFASLAGALDAAAELRAHGYTVLALGGDGTRGSGRAVSSKGLPSPPSEHRDTRCSRGRPQ